MPEQERITQNTEHHRQSERQVPLLGEDGSGASSTYSKSRDALSQRFDEVLTTLNTVEEPAAGPSAPLGQSQVHQVVQPRRSTRSSTRNVSNERLVQGFRQTSGE